MPIASAFGNALSSAPGCKGKTTMICLSRANVLVLSSLLCAIVAADQVKGGEKRPVVQSAKAMPAGAGRRMQLDIMMVSIPGGANHSTRPDMLFPIILILQGGPDNTM